VAVGFVYSRYFFASAPTGGGIGLLAEGKYFSSSASSREKVSSERAEEEKLQKLRHA
jgi:hypothetical protein